MTMTVSQRYRHAAQEFARRVVAELGDQVDAIILYGSVARGEAREDSDIDVLVISPDPKAIIDQAANIRSDYTYERNYDAFISLVHLARDEFFKLNRLAYPFIQEILRDGVIIHDNGTFSGIRGEAAKAR